MLHAVAGWVPIGPFTHLQSATRQDHPEQQSPERPGAVAQSPEAPGRAPGVTESTVSAQPHGVRGAGSKLSRAQTLYILYTVLVCTASARRPN